MVVNFILSMSANNILRERYPYCTPRQRKNRCLQRISSEVSDIKFTSEGSSIVLNLDIETGLHLITSYFSSRLRTCSTVRRFPMASILGLLSIFLSVIVSFGRLSRAITLVEAFRDYQHSSPCQSYPYPSLLFLL